MPGGARIFSAPPPPGVVSQWVLLVFPWKLAEFVCQQRVKVAQILHDRGFPRQVIGILLQHCEQCPRASRQLGRGCTRASWVFCCGFVLPNQFNTETRHGNNDRPRGVNI